MVKINKKPIALYVHWPFCKKKCPYCDFNSHVTKQAIDHHVWADSLIAELDYTRNNYDCDRTLESVFFGGGTPSLMEPKTVDKILNYVHKNFNIHDDLEVTLEANPTSSEGQKFKDFHAAGINRVSIGVQSLRDSDLQFLGREHSADEAKDVITMAMSIFDRASFDLMYARPQQTIADWAVELDEALAFGVSHISLYQLTIEQGTQFFTRYKRGDFKMPHDTLAADFYDFTYDRLESAGLKAYEISNFAQPGEESRHNLAYWRYGSYIGVGPGAHGRLYSRQHASQKADDAHGRLYSRQYARQKTDDAHSRLCDRDLPDTTVNINQPKVATRTHASPEGWLKSVAQAGHAYKTNDTLSNKDRLFEQVMMGLRLKEGLSYHAILDETGYDLNAILAPQFKAQLVENGDLYDDRASNAGALRLTDQGRKRLNLVLSYLYESFNLDNIM